jgi:Uma2 family endonuclease
MAEQILAPPGAQAPPVSTEQPVPSDQSIAGLISADEYLEQYAHDCYEWVKGVLIPMVPVSLRHDTIVGYLRELLRTYFSLKPIGRVVGQPFVMQLDVTESRREPDLQVILTTNPGQLTDTAMVGPADICIEVVSPESVARDHGEKFAEYEKAGVREYWIVDPIRESCRFNRLNEMGVYSTIIPDKEDIYQTPLLPGLQLHIPTLWLDELPGIISVVQSVQAMLTGQT